MSLQLFQSVRLLSDRYEAEGARRGMVGCIIETYANDAYEVEFSDPKGITVAQIVASGSELEGVEDRT